MSKNKLAVIFPGIGYHCDKPLLYHAKKIAAAKGYEIREVPYTGFESGVKGNPDKMRRSFMKAMEQTEKILEEVRWESFGELLFTSKSIGTAIAAEFAHRHDLVTRNVYFTPVAATFTFHPQAGIVFHGTADPYVPLAYTQRADRVLADARTVIIEGAGHGFSGEDRNRVESESVEFVQGIIMQTGLGERVAA